MEIVVLIIVMDHVVVVVKVVVVLAVVIRARERVWILVMDAKADVKQAVMMVVGSIVQLHAERHVKDAGKIVQENVLLHVHQVANLAVLDVEVLVLVDVQADAMDVHHVEDAIPVAAILVMDAVDVIAVALGVPVVQVVRDVLVVVIAVLRHAALALDVVAHVQVTVGLLVLINVLVHALPLVQEVVQDVTDVLDALVALVVATVVLHLVVPVLDAIIHVQETVLRHVLINVQTRVLLLAQGLAQDARLIVLRHVQDVQTIALLDALHHVLPLVVLRVLHIVLDALLHVQADVLDVVDVHLHVLQIVPQIVAHHVPANVTDLRLRRYTHIKNKNK